MSEATVSYGKTTLQERLLALQMKKNEARGRIKKATESERELDKGGPHALEKREKREEEQRQEAFKASLEAEGVDADKHYRMHVTEEAQEWKERGKKRGRNAPELDIFGQDGQYKAFKKQRNMTDFDKDAYEKQRDQQGEEFYQPTASLAYGQEVHDDPEKIKALVGAHKKQAEKNAKFSRRRAFDDTQDIDFINERNRKFNLKIKRAYDQYTEEIRDNIERGSAI